MPGQNCTATQISPLFNFSRTIKNSTARISVGKDLSLLLKNFEFNIHIQVCFDENLLLSVISLIWDDCSIVELYFFFLKEYIEEGI